MNVLFLNRDDSPYLLQGLDLEVTRLTWAALGGPDRAVLQGDFSRLARRTNFPQWARDMLRRPVVIHSDRGQPCWWGFVSRVEIDAGGLVYSYDLDDLANRVAVVYHQRRPAVDWSGDLALTPWAEAPHSLEVYGRKERILTGQSLLEAEALAMRDTWLQSSAEPEARTATRPSSSASVSLSCRGWYATLDWAYPDIHLDYEGFVQPAQSQQSLGRTTNQDAMLAQRFCTGYGPWLLGEVAVDAKVVGQCGDNLVLSLCSDSQDSPSTVLASASLPAAQITGGRWYVHFQFDIPVTIQANTDYWFKLNRSGSVNADNYYLVYREDNNAYAGGLLKYWTGSYWSSVSGGLADINFYLVGLQDSTERIGELAGAALGGQFLSGIHWKASASGYTLLWKSEVRTCRVELEELLRKGDASGTRLLARVNQDRELEICALPPAGQVEFLLSADGSLRSLGGRPVELGDVQAGQRALLSPGWQDEEVILWGLDWSPDGLRVALEESNPPNPP